MEQPMQPDDTCLLSLEDNVLLHIAALLPGPCRQQLRGGCRRLRRLMNELVIGADVSCEVDPFDEVPSLACFPALKALNLHSCPDSDTTAAILESAPRQGRHLTALSMNGADLSQLGHELSALTSLKQLSLSHCSNAHELVEMARAWPALERLALARCSRGDPLEPLLGQLLGSCPAVTGLRFAGSSWFGRNQQWVELAPALARLKTLCWRDSQSLGGAAIMSMLHEGMPCADWALQDLDLSYTRVSDPAMRYLSQLPQLRRLGLKGTNVGDEGLALLSSLTGLTALHIKHCHRVTDDGVRALAPVTPSLHELSIGYQLTLEADVLCQALAESLPQLQHLDLLSDELSDAGVEALGRLGGLRALLLWQAAQVTAPGLAALLSSVHLTRLTLYACDGAVACKSADTASPGLAAVAAHATLRELHLGALPDLACADLAALAQLPSLHRLTLEDMPQVGPELLHSLLVSGAALHDLYVCGCPGLPEDALAQVMHGRVGTCSGAGGSGRDASRMRGSSSGSSGSSGSQAAGDGRAWGDIHHSSAWDKGAGSRRKDRDTPKGRDAGRAKDGNRQSERKVVDDNCRRTKQAPSSRGDKQHGALGFVSRRGPVAAAEGSYHQLQCPTARLWALPVADPASDEEGEDWMDRRRRSPMYQRLVFNPT